MTDEQLASLDGRIAAMEVLTAHMLAHLVVQFDQPVTLAAHILDGVESALLRAEERTPEAGKRSAAHALKAYARVRDAMLAMINAIAEPQGQS